MSKLQRTDKSYKKGYKQGQQDCINGIYNFDGDDVSGQTFSVKPKR